MYDNKSGEIEQLKRRLLESEGMQTKKSSYWQRLSDHCSKMSPDQLSYIDSNQKVSIARNQMFEAFIMYLFDKHKDSFAENESCLPLCDAYVEAVLTAGQEYTIEVVDAMNENALLKAKLKELENELKEKRNAKPKAD